MLRTYYAFALCLAVTTSWGADVPATKVASVPPLSPCAQLVEFAQANPDDWRYICGKSDFTQRCAQDVEGRSQLPGRVAAYLNVRYPSTPFAPRQDF